MLKVKEHNGKIEFPPHLIAEFDQVVARYPEGKQKSALLPILHKVQAHIGWLPVEAMNKVAEYLNIQYIEVFEVATFYTMFFLEPQANYVLEVCRTGPCAVVGAEKIFNYLEKKLGVKENETTADGLFSFRGVECLASCHTGPVLQIGPSYTYYENLDTKKIDALIEELRNKHG